MQGRGTARSGKTMGGFLIFLAGAVCGGSFGVLILCLVQAGRDGRD